MARATSVQGIMNTVLQEQEYIQMFSAYSTSEPDHKKDPLISTEYAVLYKDFEESIDPNASAHLWLYPALNRTTSELNNHLHLQNALNKISKLPPSPVLQSANIQLKKSITGKPYLGSPYEKIAVSFSYTQQFGLLGLSTRTAIGIDIVEITESFKISEVVNSQFHFSEQLFFKTLDSTLAKNWFFNAWTLKESALKCTGEGIASGGLSKIIVRLMNNSYFINNGFEKEKAIAGSLALKRNDIELVIGVSVYGF